MGTSYKQPFNIDGRLLGFDGDDWDHPKYLAIATSQGEYQIKLPKELRTVLPRTLTPGEWIQVTGLQKEDWKKGTRKFKAYRVVRSVPHGPQPVEETAPQLACGVIDTPSSQKQVSKASILVCGKSKCCKRGGEDLCETLETALRDRGLTEQVTIKATGCMKRCKAGPNLIVMPDKAKYSQVDAKQVITLIDRHFSVAP